MADNYISMNPEKEINKMGFGFLRLPQLEVAEEPDGSDRGEAEKEESADGKKKTEKKVQKICDWDKINKLVDRYFELGGIYIDTAYTYLDGQSEMAVKKCVVERKPRDSFFLSEKLPGYLCKSYEDCEKYFREELERCGVDYFDVFMLHWLNQKNYAIAEKNDEFRFLREKKEQGLAKRIGFSFHDSAELLDEILTKHPEIDVVLIQINFLDWDSAGIESGKCYDIVMKHGKKVFVMEPVKGGSLASLPEEAEEYLRGVHPDWTPSDWALRFVQSLPGVELCLSGMNELTHVEANLKKFHPFTDREKEALFHVRGIIESQTAVPCTGCRYCVSHCPMNIPIPEYFRMYNEKKRYPQDGWKIIPTYRQMNLTYGKASDCIECHSCEQHCPQHIPIAEKILRVKYSFERDLV